jgi:opacity protein-like surface antigen
MMQLRRASAGLMAGSAVVALICGATGAAAENCTASSLVLSRTSGLPSLIGSTANSISAAITTTNSAFLTQSSALVGVPANAQPDQIGGGAWSRAVGGVIEFKTHPSQVVTTSNGTTVFPDGSGTVSCSSQIHAGFEGIQVGADLGKLNLNGWNFHYGLTAGSLWTQSSIVGGAATNAAGAVAFGGAAFENSLQVPFFGAYATLSGDNGLFADFLVRGDFYHMNFNSPGLNLLNQGLDARGLSVTGSGGWNYQIPNTAWFIEPSAGVIYSRVSVDPMNIAGNSLAGVPGAAGTISGTLSPKAIENTIGRVGLRGGTSFNIGSLALQPFAAVSLWHDFNDTNSGSYQTCNGCGFVAGTPAILSSTYRTQNMGTYGQYSLGISGQFADTGWLGFGRIDYRNGDRVQGWNVTGGFRYQFAPGAPARTVVTKGPLIPVLAAPMNWSGLYIGTQTAAAMGRGILDFGGGLRSDPRLGGYGAGGQIGYNYQINQLVLGIEADVNTLNLQGSRACGRLNGLQPPLFAPTVIGPLFDQTCNAHTSGLGTVTLRGGYAWDRVLVYAKAGGAATRETFAVSCNQPFAVPGSAGAQCSNVAGVMIAGVPYPGFNTGDFRFGWTAGLGFEFAMTERISAKAEVDYVDFGKHRRTFSDGTIGDVGAAAAIVKIGVNYHLPSLFYWGTPAVVAARY